MHLPRIVPLPILILVGLASALPAQTQTLTASLDGDQVVAATGSSASAWAVVLLQPSGSVSITVDVDDLATANSCELRLGAPGTTGPAIVTLNTATPGGGAKTWTGSAMLGASDLQAVQAGQTHLVVGSPAFPNGEIRGQVVLPTASRYAAFVVPANVVPPVTGTQQGPFRAHLLEPDNHLVVTFGGTGGVFSTHFELRHGAAGVNGPLLHTWYGQTSQGHTFGESRKLSELELQWLRAGELYIEAWGNPYPYTVNKAIARDQLRPIAKPWTGTLTPANVVPSSPSTGQNMAHAYATASYDIWSFYAERNFTSENQCYLRHGLPGTNGPILHQFSPFGGGSYWRLPNRQLSANELQWLENGECYIETALNGVPQTRAQVVPSVPETPSFGGGCPDSNGTQWHLMETDGFPAAGGTAGVRLVGHGPRPQFGLGLMAVGFRNEQHFGVPLPLRLDAIGTSPDCYLLVEGAIVYLAGNGAVSFTQLVFPHDPQLQGAELMVQGAMFDPAVHGSIATTNGLLMTVH